MTFSTHTLCTCYTPRKLLCPFRQCVCCFLSTPPSFSNVMVTSVNLCPGLTKPCRTSCTNWSRASSKVRARQQTCLSAALIVSAAERPLPNPMRSSCHTHSCGRLSGGRVPPAEGVTVFAKDTPVEQIALLRRPLVLTVLVPDVATVGPCVALKMAKPWAQPQCFKSRRGQLLMAACS